MPKKTKSSAPLIAEPQLDAPTQWLSLANTAKYLGVSTMSVTRYDADEKYAYLNFPKPSVVVDRCYWSRDDIDAWMRSRVGAVSSRKIKTKETVA